MDTASRLRGLVRSPTTPLSGGTVARLAGLPSSPPVAPAAPAMSAAAAALAASITAGARPPLPPPPPSVGARGAAARPQSPPRRLRLGPRHTVNAFKPAARSAPASPLGILPTLAIPGDATRCPPSWVPASLVGTCSVVTFPSGGSPQPSPLVPPGSPSGSPPPSPTAARRGGWGVDRLLLAPSVCPPVPRAAAKRAAGPPPSAAAAPVGGSTPPAAEPGRRRRAGRPSVGFRCTHPGCGVVSRFRSYARTHARLHSSELPFECPVDGCSRRFKWASSLGYHKRRHAELEKQARELREFCEQF